MKDYLKQKWPGIIVLGLISGLLLFLCPQITFSEKTAATSSVKVSAPLGEPLRLIIPTLKIDTAIESVGMTSQGGGNECT